MPKYQQIYDNEIMGCPLEYGSEEREKLRQGYAHQVQIEAGRLGVLEVKYFHPLSISNLTLTCACCGKTCASYSGVYKHSKKCTGIHPQEKLVGSMKTAHKPIVTESTLKKDGPLPAKISPQGDATFWMGDGVDYVGTMELDGWPNTDINKNNETGIVLASDHTEDTNELQDICAEEYNQINNNMSERTGHDIHNKSETPKRKECNEKTFGGGKREGRNQIHTRSRAKMDSSKNSIIGYM